MSEFEIAEESSAKYKLRFPRSISLRAIFHNAYLRKASTDCTGKELYVRYDSNKSFLLRHQSSAQLRRIISLIFPARIRKNMKLYLTHLCLTFHYWNDSDVEVIYFLLCKFIAKSDVSHT